jgi:hypothetical protein
MGWQPIETAPDEGDYIVYDAFWKQTVVVNARRLSSGRLSLVPVMGGYDPEHADDATHWMPLPDPPKPEEGGT